MKKFLLIILLSLAIKYSNAQSWATLNGNLYNTSGYVGIGTNTPWQPLTVFQPNNANTYISAMNNTINTFFGAGGISWGIVGTASNHDFAIYTGNTEKMRISVSGNVGIGTPNPIGNLDVRGNFFIGTSDLSIGKVGSFVQIDQGNAAGDTYSRIRAYSHGGTVTDNLVLQGSGGYVGIGTSNPDAKLAVSGTIHATEIRVDQNVPTPDYVFDKDYDLATLKEVKTYIDKNHHLPEIPSVTQVAKNGINLGEMNAKLLKKIEELTLYLIEKDKEMKQTKVALDELQKHDVLIMEKLRQIKSQIKSK